MLEEKISRNLGIPFVEIEHEGELKYLCSNGVLFSDAEYKNYPNLSVEYERREREDKLYDYAYAKSTGILRKKRNVFANAVSKKSNKEMAMKTDSKEIQEKTGEMVEEEQAQVSTRISDRERMDRRVGNKSVLVICIMLAFTSVISMYISTLHTATYLFDYVDLFSAWLMSASVTAYNGTAFEVSVLFKSNRRYFMSIIFMFLWILVTLFSMATTVSVFYDRFNFNETQIAEENKEVDSNKLALELLQKKEADLRESIEFKKKDIEYRQEREYATTAVRTELNKLQEELQNNLSEQQKLLSETPEVKETKIQRKESLFSFLGRLMHLEGGILEFIMSTLSAIFVNLISPLSLTAVIELRKKKELDQIK